MWASGSGALWSSVPARWYMRPEYLSHDLMDLGKCFLLVIHSGHLYTHSFEKSGMSETYFLLI